VNGCHYKHKIFPGNLVFFIQQNPLSSFRQIMGKIGMLFSIKDVKRTKN